MKQRERGCGGSLDVCFREIESQFLVPFLRNTGVSGSRKWVWFGVGRLDLGDSELAACN